MDSGESLLRSLEDGDATSFGVANNAAKRMGRGVAMGAVVGGVGQRRSICIDVARPEAVGRRGSLILIGVGRPKGMRFPLGSPRVFHESGLDGVLGSWFGEECPNSYGF
jgi:hypothetical protein